MSGFNYWFEIGTVPFPLAQRHVVIGIARRGEFARLGTIDRGRLLDDDPAAPATHWVDLSRCGPEEWLRLCDLMAVTVEAT